MPRPRHLRTVVTEVVMYVGMFVIVGHLCQNLCERFMMQNDLKIMKSDLNALEMSINNMEMAYDNLLLEVQGCLSKDTAKPAVSCYSCFQNMRPQCFLKCLKKFTNADAGTKTDSSGKDFMQNFKKSTKDFIQLWSSPGKDESTLTERLLNCFNYSNSEANEESSLASEKEFCRCVYQCLSHSGSNERYESLAVLNKKTPSNPSIGQNLTKSMDYFPHRWKLVNFPI